MSSSFTNIFPQVSSSSNQNQQNVSYQSLVNLNRVKLKTIQAQYFQNQYKRLQQIKQQQKQKQKQEKQKQRQLVRQKQQAYQIELQRKRQRKNYEKEYLSSDYSKTIDYKHTKNRYEKEINKMIEKQTLQMPTWVRDTQIERENQNKKKIYYNQVLEDQLRMKDERKKINEKTEEFMKEKLKKETEEMLQKEYDAMQARHRQKSLFEQRQNQILGLRSQSPNLEQSRTVFEKQRQLKGVQKQLYRQGLQAQYEKQINQKQSRRQFYSQDKPDLNPRYNPITNPIPFVYKNPNVLRMLNQ